LTRKNASAIEEPRRLDVGAGHVDRSHHVAGQVG
jgi:hypothetical protein